MIDPRSMSIDDVPAAVQETLAAFLDERLAEVAAIGGPVEEAAGHLRDFVLGGGKRIRPLYGWAGFVGAGGLKGNEDPRAVLRAVSSLEFIQACALIHDDIIDASDTRRGRPTVHRAVEKQHAERGWTGNSAHFGESVAILVGDLAVIWADDMLINSGLSPEAIARCQEPWRDMRTEVIGGQLLDIYLESSASEDIAAANSVNRFKTAAYTIERPLHLGAAIAKADAQLVDAFRGYGRDVGIAFQLRDDELGVFGDPAITGKPAGDDLREGKRTVLLATALHRADRTNPEAAAYLRERVGTTSDPDVIATMSRYIQESGALEDVEKRISELTESGLGYLERAGVDTTVADILRSLATKSTSRRG